MMMMMMMIDFTSVKHQDTFWFLSDATQSSDTSSG